MGKDIDKLSKRLLKLELKRVKRENRRLKEKIADVSLELDCAKRKIDKLLEV